MSKLGISTGKGFHKGLAFQFVEVNAKSTSITESGLYCVLTKYDESIAIFTHMIYIELGNMAIAHNINMNSITSEMSYFCSVNYSNGVLSAQAYHVSTNSKLNTTILGYYKIL